MQHLLKRAEALNRRLARQTYVGEREALEKLKQDLKKTNPLNTREVEAAASKADDLTGDYFLAAPRGYLRTDFETWAGAMDNAIRQIRIANAALKDIKAELK